MKLFKTDTDILREMYTDLCDASIKKDIRSISKILSDNYILVHMTGKEQTKEEFLSSVKTGELDYFKALYESINVVVNGDVATIIGKTKTLASPFGMSTSWWNLKQEITAEKINGQWLFVKTTVSTY